MILPKPAKAGLAVWYSLDLKWRGKYTIQWEVI
ncbi:hypothetical protein CHKEEEPN_4174 [Methylorubrum podarium]|nr:hypothetical protein CHKEEEPN_4174 [Methylorubrum podarium]